MGVVIHWVLIVPHWFHNILYRRNSKSVHMLVAVGRNLVYLQDYSIHFRFHIGILLVCRYLDLGILVDLTYLMYQEIRRFECLSFHNDMFSYRQTH